jgi:hypothetical protein
MLADGESTASALNSDYHLAYLIGAVAIAVAVLATLVIVSSAVPAGAEAEGAPGAEADREAARAEVASETV